MAVSVQYFLNFDWSMSIPLLSTLSITPKRLIKPSFTFVIFDALTYSRKNVLAEFPSLEFPLPPGVGISTMIPSSSLNFF